MRLLFTFLIASFGFALSGQCIFVQADSVVCSDNGGYFVLFDVEGTGPTGWVLAGTQLTGPYDTDEIREAGPFFEEVTTLTWVDIDDPDCTFSVTYSRPEGCGTTDPCFGFAAFITGASDTLCSSTYHLQLVGGSSPYEATLSDAGGNVVNVQVFSSDSIGLRYEDLPAGTYSVVVTDSRNCTTDATFSAAGTAGCGAISGRCWIDVNGNGLRDNTDDVLQMTVVARRNGTVIASTNTNTDGVYTFNQLPAGTYVLQFGAPNGFTPTLYQEGDDPTLDSDVLTPEGETGLIDVAAGALVESIDAGWLVADCSVNLIIENASCNGGQDGLIVAEPTGAAPFTFLWSNGATSSAIDELAAGFYSVTVTDAEGCRSEANGQLAESGRLRLSLQEIGSGCNGGNNADHFLNPLVFGGTQPYTYAYFVDGDVISTEQVLPNPVAGVTYVLVVTDANGCTAEISWTALGQTQNINWFAPFFLPCDGSGVEITTGDSTDLYTYTWQTPGGEILSGPSIIATEVGTYSVEGTSDVNNCVITGEAQVLSSTLTADYEIVLIDSLECGFEPCLYVISNEPNNWRPDLVYHWTLPDGSQSSSEQGGWICTEQSGLFVLQITSLCDTITLSQVLEANPECATLNGTVYIDGNADCGYDEGEIPAAGVVVMISNVDNSLVYYDITNSEGAYGTEVQLGTYTVRPVTNETQPFGTCEPPAMATVVAGSPTTVDAFLPALVDCPVLTTSVSIPFLRRCFSGGAYVDYENLGSAVAPDAQLTVTLDDYLVDAVANVTPSSRDGQTFVFDLGDLAPFASGRIWFSFTISCEANIGQIHCIEASITPDAPCSDPADWNGALVNVGSGTCNGDSVIFKVTNVGDNTMSVPLSYVVVEDGIMMTPAPVVVEELAAGQIFTIALPADGQTYQLMTNQEPNAPAAIHPTAMLEGCVSADGDAFSTGFGNILPLGNGMPAQVIECRENRGAYDPNDKNGYPLGYGADHNIEEGTRLTYAIRFQNTGTDTAFNIVIKDTISTALDLATFKPGSASHFYTVDIDTHRVVTFTFPNIMLPDSNVNLPASQGVVNFSIDHAPELGPGDQIENKAAIYFDFNLPIITNLSRHQIAKEPLPTGVRQPAVSSVQIGVFPNPSNGLVQLMVPNQDLQVQDQLLVTDLYGRPMAATTYGQLSGAWDIRHLPAGYYLLVVRDTAGQVKGRSGFVLSK